MKSVDSITLLSCSDSFLLDRLKDKRLVKEVKEIWKVIILQEMWLKYIYFFAPFVIEEFKWFTYRCDKLCLFAVTCHC